MMYEVRFTTTYKESYKLMRKRGLDVTLLFCRACGRLDRTSRPCTVGTKAAMPPHRRFLWWCNFWKCVNHVLARSVNHVTLDRAASPTGAGTAFPAASAGAPAS